MCRPTHYRIAYEINPWMNLKHPANRTRALAQWTALYRALTNTLGARVQLLPPRTGVPDLTFTANAGLVVNRTVIRSNFRYAERQPEEPIVERYFERHGYRVVTLPRSCRFEGEGDALWVQNTLIFGFRFRSDAPTHEALARVLKVRVLPIELADRRFYHLDTCFCPLDAHSALWDPKAFDRYGRAVLENLIPNLIAVSESDAERFVCNAIPLGRHLVLPAGASTPLRRQLNRRGWRLTSVNLSEFLKAGGAAKCLVLWLQKPAGLPHVAR